MNGKSQLLLQYVRGEFPGDSSQSIDVGVTRYLIRYLEDVSHISHDWDAGIGVRRGRGGAGSIRF